MKDVKLLLKKYEQKKDEIRNRLKEFHDVFNESDERIFAELAFCLCTPQSKATTAWRAIEALMKNNLLYVGDEKQIRPFLNNVRFADNKARYIVDARKKFTLEGRLQIKTFIQSFIDVYELREWLVENVKGLGMKEASHFIRNIGFSFDVAILDVHVLRQLKEYNVIKEIPKTLTKKVYLQIENKVKEFANSLNLRLAELDLLFWSEETGFIFK
ncbi:MAG: N-glycosylase/DNA lyase [Candidatus Aenigmatarchaeota archaeon]